MQALGEGVNTVDDRGVVGAAEKEKTEPKM